MFLVTFPPWIATHQCGQEGKLRCILVGCQNHFVFRGHEMTVMKNYLRKIHLEGISQFYLVPSPALRKRSAAWPALLEGDINPQAVVIRGNQCTQVWRPLSVEDTQFCPAGDILQAYPGCTGVSEFSMQNLPNLSFKFIVLPTYGQRRLNWGRMGAQGVKDNMATFGNQLFNTKQSRTQLI